MRQDTTKASEVTIGMDLGDKYSQICVLSGEGEVVERSRIRTTETDLRRRFSGMGRTRIAVEVGTHSPWVSRLLEECGHEGIVANARRLRLIYENDNKDDQVDAEYLARLARMDPKLLYPIQHRKKEAQQDLAVIRAREGLVEARTKLVNLVRGSVKAMGGRLPKCSTPTFAGKVRPHVPEELETALGPVLDVIEDLTKKIRAYDRHIERMAQEKYPETRALQQVTGVGALTSVAFVLTLEDPKRFKKSRAVGAFLGMRPAKAKSGRQDPQRRISKSGDQYLRKLLVGSAHYILGPFGPDTDLRRWGLKLCQRGGKNAKKRAVVAVARKLSVLLHRLWVTQETYEPLRQAKRKTAEDRPKEVS